MFNFQRVFIAILGIVLSFLLFAEGEKYNIESNAYSPLIRYCQEKRFDQCEYRYVHKQAEIEEKYGAPYWVLERRLKEQKIYVIIPCVILIVALFVCFTLDEKEILLTVLVLIPFLVSLIVRFIFDSECCLTPFYLLYAACLGFVISTLKRFLGFVDP